ncbi:MAG: uracil-DNA glycosylase family protein [Prevotella sp.]|nr:uracil-DNA glycosylase family protein [Prevotella sp.]MCI6462410.1 uracil-DNA glycosylase family protein [Prevotella sp.]MCI6500143.1 uracil-DNA glycosylase family protein [Prevotella sp.]MCI7340993.1 uracil-DNA glycosylase family protein [Prevotella sp.]MDY3671516.1 uracil-DNA glycosylase family protein [Prevotella sp.]
MSNIEEHPFTPFLPDNARLLMLGTFPPSPKRWCMEFYYPNFTNDMWRIFGICFFDDKNHFVVSEKKTYNLPAIIDFLNERGVALYDTARRVVRTKNTASDKDLMIVEQTDFDAMLSQLAQCRAVATAGQLATTVFCSHFGIPEPKVGGYTEFAFGSRMLRLYRMPSSSRAYPMKVEAKAEVYWKMFSAILLKSDKDNL